LILVIFFGKKIIEFVIENVQKFATVQKFPTQKRLISLVVLGAAARGGGGNTRRGYVSFFFPRTHT
jgi:hypothetical protein